LSYTKADGSTLEVSTRVGAKPTADTLRRFLVGPVDCEITGLTETPDGQSLFSSTSSTRASRSVRPRWLPAARS
jgi:secreted PhoX family phosphatase